MDSIFQRQAIKLSTVCDFSHLSERTQAHLKRVYSTLLLMMIVAGAAAYEHIYYQWISGGFWSLLLSLVALGVVGFTNKKNEPLRFGSLLAFAALQGLSLGPLLTFAISVDAGIVPTAFLGTAIVFGCLSLCALRTTDRGFLYLGGMLSSGLSLLLILSLLSFAFRATWMFNIQLYLGLLVFCGYVLFDTQLVIEKRNMGDDDFIWHSVDLFIDFIAIFVRIVILLTKKSKKDD